VLIIIALLLASDTFVLIFVIDNKEINFKTKQDENFNFKKQIKQTEY
jgi:hypothetical protein